MKYLPMWSEAIAANASGCVVQAAVWSRSSKGPYFSSLVCLGEVRRNIARVKESVCRENDKNNE
jgi:hypothetical protein